MKRIVSHPIAACVLLAVSYVLSARAAATAKTEAAALANPEAAAAAKADAAAPAAAPANPSPAAPKSPDDTRAPAVDKPGTTVAGDWQGTLDAGGTKLRLAVHIKKSDDGALKATLDSLDQGAMGIGVDKVTFDGSALRLDLTSIGARFEGTLGRDGAELAGTWSQGAGSLPLRLARVAGNSAAEPEAPKPVPSDAIKPLWMGTLDAGGGKLRLVLHLARGADGILTATIDSLDQGASGIHVDSALFKDGKLRLELKALGARFEGIAGKDGTELTGQWIQNGVSMPLVLTAIDKTPSALRPQEPKRPLPYSEEEVSYSSQPAGVTLACTLTTPRGAGPFPAAILVTGSGPEDRDETVFGHRPFLVLSDHLTRQGIAVLRCDDRGVGGSGAGPPGPTTESFVDDALSGVAFLKTRKEIDATRIGLIGHSEGGLIAPRAAVRSKDVSFVVMLAGPGLPGADIIRRQTGLIMKAEGASDADVQTARALNDRLHAILQEEKDDAAAAARIRKELAGSPGVTEAAVDATTRTLLSPWFRHFLTYDPAPTLARVQVPIFAVNGERDLQVPAQDNAVAIRTALRGAGHKEHTVLVLPGLNHLFQECRTGSPTEYASIEQTFSPTALTTVSDWIFAHTRRPIERAVLVGDPPLGAPAPAPKPH